MIFDPQEMSEVFVRSIRSVFLPVLPQVLNPNQESETEMSQLHLTLYKVFSQLNNLDESSAPGSDDVNHKLFKSCAVTLSYTPLLILHKIAERRETSTSLEKLTCFSLIQVRITKLPSKL